MNSIAIFSGSKLGEGPWRPGRKVSSIAVFGGSEVDFRQAEMEEGITQVTAVSIFGGNKIIVPSDISVSLSGVSILGGRELKRTQTKEAPASGKVLQVKAIASAGAAR